jgi:hypothetical protein
MSQNKFTTFIHNNLITTIITALIIGGGLSALAFSTYNSGAKSVQSDVTAITVSSQSSSSVIKSSSVSSSILSSSIISSSSSEVSKKEPVKETPKTVEVEKAKVVEEVKPTKITDTILKNPDSPTGFGIDGSFSFSNIKLSTPVAGPEVDWFSLKSDSNEYYNFKHIAGAKTDDIKMYDDIFYVSGTAKLVSPGYYDVLSILYFNKINSDQYNNANTISNTQNIYTDGSGRSNLTIPLENTFAIFYRASSYEGAMFYDFKTENNLIIRVLRSDYPNLKIDFIEKNYCLSNCLKFVISGTVKYSNYFNADKLYKTYNEVNQGDVYEPFDFQVLSIQKN